MPLTVEQLVAAFPRNEEKGEFAAFEYDAGIQRFVGEVVSQEFSGMTVAERQGHVWDVLKDKFGDEAESISLVLTLSPEEWEEVGDRAAS